MCSNFGRDKGTPVVPFSRSPAEMLISLPALWYGSGLKRTVLMIEKIAVLAPMPKARVRIATTVNPGPFSRGRKANAKSCKRVCMASHSAGMRVGATFLFRVWMASRFFGRGGRRRFLRGKVGVKDVGDCFPTAVGLFFPNLDKFAAIRSYRSLGIVGHQLIGADDVGQIAGMRDIYLGGLPCQRSAGAQQRIPGFANRLLVAGDRRVGSKERSIITVVADGCVQILGRSGLGPLGVQSTNGGFIRGAGVFRRRPAARRNQHQRETG